MQLEQILGAAVAAGNVEEVAEDNMPSPDVPQTSPGPPIPCSTRRPSYQEMSRTAIDLDHENTIEYENANKNASVSQKIIKLDFQVSPVSIDMTSTDPLNAVSDEISLFNLGEDSLVITSQQALAMFETNNEETQPSMNCEEKSQPNPVRISQNNAEELPDDNGLQEAAKPLATIQTMQSIDISDQCDDGVPSACGEIEIQTTTEVAVQSDSNTVPLEQFNDSKNEERNEESDLSSNQNSTVSSDSIKCSIQDNLALEAHKMTENISQQKCVQNISEIDEFDPLQQISLNSINGSDKVELEKCKTFSDILNENNNLNDGQTPIQNLLLPISKISSVGNDPETNQRAMENESQPEYASLTPMSSSSVTTRLEDALGTLVGLDSPAGATLDATLDENGQFLVQVIAPGLTMSIPNQFLNKSNSEAFPSISDSTYQNKNELNLLENLSEQLADIEKSMNNEINLRNESNCEKISNKRKRDFTSLENFDHLNPSGKIKKIKHFTRFISENTNSKLERKMKKKMKKKKHRRATMNCISPDTNAQFFNQINQSQFYRPYQNYCHQETANFYFQSNSDSSNYPGGDHSFHGNPNIAVPYPYRVQNKNNNLHGNPTHSGDLNTWDIDEMLNPQFSSPNGTAGNKINGDYNCFDTSANTMPLDPLGDEEESALPIIMSPEEYHGKVQGDDRYRGMPSAPEIIQTTNTDGESLKVQLVYLVYPCKKKNGETNIRIIF